MSQILKPPVFIRNSLHRTKSCGHKILPLRKDQRHIFLNSINFKSLTDSHYLYKLRDVITYPFTNFNDATVEDHYTDVIMNSMPAQITSLTIVYSPVYSDADQRKHQSSASLAFVWGIHRGPVNSPHTGPVTRKMFPFDDVIMLEWISNFIPHFTCWN